MCIIGAGIAGNYLAMLLREMDISCIVVERRKSFEDRPLQCAGICSQKLLKLVSFPSEIILNSVHDAEVFTPHLKKIMMSGRDSPVVIDRIAFDTYFGEKAQKNGTQYLFGEKYVTHHLISKNDQEKFGKIAVVQTNKRKILAKIVVGADGPMSKVARRFHIKNDYIPATQARIKMDYNTNATALYFHPMMKELFGYIVPEGDNGICRVGLGAKEKPNIAFKQFLKLLKVKKSDIISRQGGLIPFGFPKQFAFQNTVLLGDSASMVKATTGGGIVILISAAKKLAPAIEKALHHQNYDGIYLRKIYQHKIKRGFIGAQLKVHYFIRLLMIELKPYDYDYFSKLYEDTTRKNSIKKIIDEYGDMDFPLKVTEKLLMNARFVRFLIHIIFHNLKLIPKYIKAILL